MAWAVAWQGLLRTRHDEKSLNKYDRARAKWEKIDKYDKHVQHRNKAAAEAPHIFHKWDWQASNKAGCYIGRKINEVIGLEL